MTTEQKRIFLSNYNYMWDKLSTTHFVKSGNYSGKVNVLGVDLLPSYTNLSRCKSMKIDGDWFPSASIVNKIVAFYNANIQPEVTSYQFIREELYLTDDIRFRNKTYTVDRFLGKYYGYYYSASNPNETGEIIGAMMRIYREGEQFKACLITGIHYEKELQSEELNKVIDHDDPHISKKQIFDEYYNSLDSKLQRCRYYEGIVEMTQKSLLISFVTKDSRMMKKVVTFNIDKISHTMKKSYKGGLAFVLSTNDGFFDTRFYLMAFMRATRKTFSFDDIKLKNILKVKKKKNDTVLLSSYDDQKWYELILEQEEIINEMD